MAPTLGLAERPLGPARWGYVTTRDLYRAIVDGQPYPVRAVIGFGANMLLAHADGPTSTSLSSDTIGASTGTSPFETMLGLAAHHHPTSYWDPDLVNLTMLEYLLAIGFCSVGSFRQTQPRAHGHPALTPEPTPPLPLLSEFGKIPVEADHDFLAILVLPRTACRSRVRRRARLCPPIVHNELSSCRDIVSL